MGKLVQNKTDLLTRRKFVTAIGGGIIFTVAAWKTAPNILVNDETNFNAESNGREITVYVQIHEDNRVTIYNPSSEMGQGSMSALAAIIAEELDADWSKVSVEQSEADSKVYGRMMTVGSRTVASYYSNLRQAGAQARYVLLTAVSKKWNVPLNELTTEPNVVIHENSNRKISYGEITSFLEPLDEVPTISNEQLKKTKDFRLIGKVIPRFDIPSKCDGSAEFAIDVNLPGMVYGVVSRSPVNGAKPTLLNESAIRSIEGIVDIVVMDHGVGLVTNTFELALKIKPTLQINWSTDNQAETFNSEGVIASYREIASESTAKGNTIFSKQNIFETVKAGGKYYSSEYQNDFVYHAQMEPMNAVISVAKDGQSAEAWVGTQAPSSGRSAVARELGIDSSKVNFHRTYLGGGFGRRATSGWVTEATKMAKIIKRPLKLIWTREDDLQYGMFRPKSLHNMQALIDKNDNVIGWQHIIVGTGGRLIGTGSTPEFYAIPNTFVETRNVNHGVRTKHWRAVGHGPNKFAIESFVDEISKGQGQDPLAFRLNLMKDQPRAQKVLQEVAKMADWNTPSQKGRAKGISFAERSSSLAACVCELSVDESSGEIKIHRIWASLDAGIVVQPDNAIAQMEGAILMGVSSILKESVTFKDGKVEQSNFDDYQILRMSEVPDSIEVKIIPSEEKPTGIGETGLPIIGGAIANAFSNLTGKQLKHIPFTPSKVLDVLKS